MRKVIQAVVSAIIKPKVVRSFDLQQTNAESRALQNTTNQIPRNPTKPIMPFSYKICKKSL